MDIKLFHKEKKNNILKSEGAVLYIDRNKRKATGYYYMMNCQFKRNTSKFKISYGVSQLRHFLGL